MFVKRDYRKIDLILSDKAKDRTLLKLSNRKEEFQGRIQILCRETIVANCLSDLKTLNLYANDIDDLTGIGLLSSTALEELNLGNNKLETVPPEMKELSKLKILFLEDNEFTTFPIALCQLSNLIELRLSNNSISSMPESLRSLENLQFLALDNNELEEFPQGILELPMLKELWLRQNKMTVLPENLECLENLEILSVSSNSISLVPSSLIRLKNLRDFYANHNNITDFDFESVSVSSSLRQINLANNRIAALPSQAGLNSLKLSLDQESGILTMHRSETRDQANNAFVAVNMNGNPIVSIKR